MGASPDTNDTEKTRNRLGQKENEEEDHEIHCFQSK